MNTARDSLRELLADLPRGRSAEDIGLPPNAYFESPANVAATRSLAFDAVRNAHSKIFLGVVGGDVVNGGILNDGSVSRFVRGGVPIGIGSDTHLTLVAGSRSGKGRSCLIPTTICLPPTTSLVCVDPKGQIGKITAPWRATFQKVAILDPFELTGSEVSQFRCVYNALETLLRSNRKTFVPNAKLIADSLIVSGDFKDKHWDECSRAAAAFLCAHVATHSNYEGRRDLITVWELASQLGTRDPSSPTRYVLERELTENDAASGMIRKGARDFFDRTGGEFSSVLSNLRKHLDFISIECLHDVLRGDSIDLRDLKRDAMSLYLSVPALRMTDLSGWLRLVVQMAFAACEEEQQSIGHHSLFLLDEFSVMGRLKSAETAIAQLAGMGVKCWVVVQDLNQLKSSYKESWETFIANSGVVQFFGGADETTLSYFSKLLGESMAISRSTSSPTHSQAVKEAASGASWSLVNKPLMTPDELARFFGRDDPMLRQLVLRPGYRPMILQRAFYDKHELFRGKFSPR